MRCWEKIRQGTISLCSLNIYFWEEKEICWEEEKSQRRIAWTCNHLIILSSLAYQQMFQSRVWRIYSNLRIFFIRIFIQIFIRIIFWISIYSDIRSCQLFGYKYIRIFGRGKILIQIYSDICSYQFSGHKQIQKMFLLIFSGYYTLLMDILLISMIKNAI